MGKNSLEVCLAELDEVQQSLRALDADTYIPGDDTPRGRQIARLAERRGTLLKEKYVLQARLAQVEGWPTDAEDA